jgi:hypothetical protein
LNGPNLGIHTLYVRSFLPPEIFIPLKSLLENIKSLHCSLNPALDGKEFKLFQDPLSPKARVSMYSYYHIDANFATSSSNKEENDSKGK